MHDDNRFEFDGRESPFLSQLPSVLIAAAAIGLIVLVNVIAPGQAAARSALPRAEEPRAAPATETSRSGRPSEPAASGASDLPPVTAQRA